ncbi:MAG: hypothetical protein GY913_01110 [Proteobacteria bacterium]|nr:hypothetical protein [Pseudomonadota bacterium]MCP4915497.1 hypothetical protein [Pseudomonadota bacterium]
MLLFALVGCEALTGGSEADEVLWADLDGDGYARAEGDCNDEDAAVFPNAEESCNAVDDDCDQEIDEGWEHLWYLDSDGDGYGDPATEVDSCEQPQNYLPTGGDCADDDSDRFPGADETCNGLDDDCDGQADDDVVDTWYLDEDQDGYGDPAVEYTGCTPLDGYVDNDFDCDDGDAAKNASAQDGCDGIDNDCNGEVDEDPDLVWYIDNDGDGLGDDEYTTLSCTAVSGYAQEAGDCLDSDAEVTLYSWYADTDGDGYGDANNGVLQQCEQPSGFVSVGDDCDDSDKWVNPSAPETCNGIDDDCDITIDNDDAIDASTWHVDWDSDGYGDAGFAVMSCTQPSGYVADDTDCDDGDAEFSPAATESCDYRDNDCDGDTDESGSIGETTWYTDADGDGYGADASSTTACWEPSSSAKTGGDCDDANAEVSPLADEKCDGVDNDCDGNVDENSAIDTTVWYADTDGDGFGDNTSSLNACDEPSGYVDDDTDCDDTNGDINPDAKEVCDDGVDDDCSGTADDGCQTDHCGKIGSDEDWEQADNPHVVTCSVSIESGATVTVDDGVEVYFDAGTWIEVGGTSTAGDLKIEGTSSGVTFESSEGSPAEGDWVGLKFADTSLNSTIEGLTIKHAGGGAGSGCLNIHTDMSIVDSEISKCEGSGVALVDEASVMISGTTIQNNVGDGIEAGADARILHFESNTVTANGDYPIEGGAVIGAVLDNSSNYTGNGTDVIALNGGTVDSDIDYAPLTGTPYLLTAYTYYGSTTGTTVNFQDGVEFYLEPNVQLYFGQGSDFADVTNDGDLLITSSEGAPGPGDWRTLYFGAGGTAMLDGITVEYGGKVDGMIYCYQCTLDITNSTITDSAHYGIENNGGSVTASGNTYSNNALGDESGF